MQEAISAADADHDGYVEFDEFVVIMKRAEEMKSTQTISESAWTQLFAKQYKALLMLTFPAGMVLLTAAGVIFSHRYIGSSCYR